MNIFNNTPVKPFRFWCQKVLPLVYDDSLSYYEVLEKVKKYLNECIKNGNDLSKAMQNLCEYVNNYFATADFQNAVSEGIADLVASGVITNTFWVRNNVEEMKQSVVAGGGVIMTLGYYEKHDGGGAFYSVEKSDEVGDNVVTFSLSGADGDKYLATLFTGEQIIGSQIGLIGEVTDEHMIAVNETYFNDIICDKDFTSNIGLSVNNSIKINGQYTYTGSGSAITLTKNNSALIGTKIVADNGTAISILRTVNATPNYVEGITVNVDKIEANIGVELYPLYGGINWSNISVRTIVAHTYGVYIHTTNEDRLTWVGECIFDIDNINAPVGVYIYTQPAYDGVVKKSTITGITFEHLAVEYSETGVRLESGNRNTNDSNDGIKSVVINNFRTREYTRTTHFLEMIGFVQDCTFNATGRSYWDSIDVSRCTANYTSKSVFYGGFCKPTPLTTRVCESVEIYNGKMFPMVSCVARRSFASGGTYDWATSNLAGTMYIGATGRNSLTINNIPLGANNKLYLSRTSNAPVLLTDADGRVIYNSENDAEWTANVLIVITPIEPNVASFNNQTIGYLYQKYTDYTWQYNPTLNE